jgi:hypothetical protein
LVNLCLEINPGVCPCKNIVGSYYFPFLALTE